MKKLHFPRVPGWMLLFAGCFATSASAQQTPAGSAAIEGVKGVKQDAVESVKNVQTGTVQPAAATIDPQGVKKVDGVSTVNGVKVPGQQPPPPPPPPEGQAPPPPPPPQGKVEPPPPARPPVGSVAPAANGSVGSAAAIRAVKGVTGLNPLKRENLEAALRMKAASAGTPVGSGAENGGKGKAAAAALLSGIAETPPAKPGPKEDGRAKLQEIKKLLETGS
jgi:hypothetical protein